MTYALGLDLGTTYTAAAIWRDGTVDMVGLGTHSHVVPSVVHLREDGTLVTGEAAVRRAVTEPGRTGREFKRRLGDPTPMLLGGTPFAALDLMTALLRDVLATVTEREGGPPTAVALTHPANWGQFKIDLLRQSAVACGLTDVALVTEPVAAAVHYAAGAGVAPGATVAVFDLGGGTFDVAVLRRTDDGFELLGEPVGLERVGGVDFDHAVMAHVERAVADALGSRSSSDPEVAVALARLHDECVAAKEGLSEDSEVTIPVALPGLWTDVRMTRQEFESMIAPVLAEPMRAFQRGLASAGVTGDELDAVVMVGGSSRVPLVAETVASALGRPVALDTHPKHAVALGAARLIGAATADVAAPPPAAERSPASAPATETEEAPASVTPIAAAAPARSRRRRRPVLAIGAAAAAAAIGVGAFFAVAGSDSPTSAAGAATTSVGGTIEASTASTVPAANHAATHAGASSTTAPALPPAESLCGSESGMCALITDINLEGGRYVVDYATVGFEPLIHGDDPGADEGDHHVHFFFGSTAAANAGVNGEPPGSWEIWGLRRGGGQRVFDEFTVDDANGASELCVAVATSGHAVLDDAARTGNCVELPR